MWFNDESDSKSEDSGEGEDEEDNHSEDNENIQSAILASLNAEVHVDT
jgi:hypothetical protein